MNGKSRSAAPGSMSSQRSVVAMIADYPRHLDSIDGGVQAATAYLVSELVKSDEIDLHVVSFDVTVRAPNRVLRNGVKRHILPAQRLGAITRWRYDDMSLRKCLNEIKPTIVHAQGAGIDGFLATKSGYPSVVTVHGIIAADARYMSSMLARIRLTLQGWTTERYCVRHATRTILISPYVQEYYGNLLRGIGHFIPNPVNEKFYEVQRSEVPHRILFAGRLIPIKGVTDLIEAFAEIREHTDARLILAGSLADKIYVRRVRQKAHTLNLESHIEFRGLLKEPALLEEFSRASVLVLPSYRENAPMVIQQAMAASIPVVAARVGGVPYQVEHQETGLLFEPGDVRALAAHVMYLFENDPARYQMGQNARAKALAEYRAECVAAQTLAVYRELRG